METKFSFVFVVFFFFLIYSLLLFIIIKFPVIKTAESKTHGCLWSQYCSTYWNPRTMFCHERADHFSLLLQDLLKLSTVQLQVVKFHLLPQHAVTVPVSISIVQFHSHLVEYDNVLEKKIKKFLKCVLLFLPTDMVHVIRSGYWLF